MQEADLLSLGYLASLARSQWHAKDAPVTFVVDTNVNYTNVCVCGCTFCAFYVGEKNPSGYVLEYPDIKRKIELLVANNGTQLLMQGGLNPQIPFEYYIELIKNIKKDFPSVTIHSFSPPEIDFISRNAGLSIEETLVAMKHAGLDSLPGGGAEILVDHVRQQISPNKISSDRWLEVMKVAHRVGFPTTATMMYGTVEQPSDIITHLDHIRNLQDETSGFKAFIPWNFQKIDPKKDSSALFSGQDYLKTIAISRIMLDNIENIQASWPTQGLEVAQVALSFGANDLGGTLLEENVISSTGKLVRSSKRDIIKAIKSTGKVAAQRTTQYKLVAFF